MIYTISAANLPFISKFFYCFSRLGDQIHIDPQNDAITMRLVNPARSAFACLAIRSRCFLNIASEDGYKSIIYTVPSKAITIPFSGNKKTNEHVTTQLMFKTDSLVQIRFSSILSPTSSYRQFTVYGQEDSSNSEALQAVYCKEGYKWFAQINAKSLLMIVRSCCNTLLSELQIEPGDQETIFYGTSSDSEYRGTRSKCIMPCSSFKRTDLKAKLERKLIINVREILPWLTCLVQLKSDWDISIYAGEQGNPLIFSVDTDPDIIFDLVLATVEEVSTDVSAKETIENALEEKETKDFTEPITMANDQLNESEALVNVSTVGPYDHEYVRKLFDLDGEFAICHDDPEGEILVYDSDPDDEREFAIC